jgi:hypothetical protein
MVLPHTSKLSLIPLQESAEGQKPRKRPVILYFRAPENRALSRVAGSRRIKDYGAG